MPAEPSGFTRRAEGRVSHALVHPLERGARGERRRGREGNAQDTATPDPPRIPHAVWLRATNGARSLAVARAAGYSEAKLTNAHTPRSARMTQRAYVPFPQRAVSAVLRLSSSEAPGR